MPDSILPTVSPNKPRIRFALPVIVFAGLLLVWLLYPRLVGANVYTLYRNSASDIAASGFSPERIHVATFDADETGTYNQQNCDIARGLFFEQQGVTVNYWCEKGRYKR